MYTLDRRLDGPQSWSGHSAAEKILLCQKFNCSYSAFTLSQNLFNDSVLTGWELLYQIKR
jgi:hypothetical protein